MCLRMKSKREKAAERCICTQRFDALAMCKRRVSTAIPQNAILSMEMCAAPV